MLKGEKAAVFWVGLLVFGYSLAQLCAAIWQTIYYVVIYPRVFPVTLTPLVEAQAVYPLIPLIIGGVILRS